MRKHNECPFMFTHEKINKNQTCTMLNTYALGLSIVLNFQLIACI